MPARQLTEEERARIQAFIDDECPVDEIARTLGITRAQIVREFPGYRASGATVGQIGVMMKRFRAIPDTLTRTDSPHGR